MRHYKEKILAALLLTSVGVSACSVADIKGGDPNAIGSQGTALDNNSSSNNEAGDTSGASESADNTATSNTEGNNTAGNNTEDNNTASGNAGNQTSDLYESFLNGSSKAKLNDKFFDGSILLIAPDDRSAGNAQSSNLDTVNGFTIDDLKTVISDNGYECTSKPAYAYVDFGKDGKNELVVRDEVGSSYIASLVFSDENGSVELTYAADQGERWSLDLLDNGFISNYGSSGAGAHSGCTGALDSQGVYHNFQSEYEVYYGWGIYGDYSKEEDFNEVIDAWAKEKDSRQGESICYTAVTIGDAEYYCYSNYDETGAITDDDINELVTMCAAKNIDIIDYDQIEAKVLEYQKSIGMDNITYDGGGQIEFKNL